MNKTRAMLGSVLFLLLALTTLCLMMYWLLTVSEPLTGNGWKLIVGSGTIFYLLYASWDSYQRSLK